MENFYISLNYKGEMIKTYLNSIEKDYRLEYIQEKDFLGTAGSLKLMPSDIRDAFVVSNSDVIVNLDYKDLLDFHNENKNILTIVGSMQHYRIPYGIIHFGKEGKIREIQEKPEFDFTINTGVYILSKKSLDFIPNKKSFDMPDLIRAILEKGENVGVYPVSQKSYVDVGQWDEYKKATSRLQPAV